MLLSNSGEYDAPYIEIWYCCIWYIYTVLQMHLKYQIMEYSTSTSRLSSKITVSLITTNCYISGLIDYHGQAMYETNSCYHQQQYVTVVCCFGLLFLLYFMLSLNRNIAVKHYWLTFKWIWQCKDIKWIWFWIFSPANNYMSYKSTEITWT